MMCNNKTRLPGGTHFERPVAYVIIGFLVHAAAYVVVTLGLVAINVITWSGYFWAIWPVLGWGIGVFSHGRAAVRAVIHASEYGRRTIRPPDTPGREAHERVNVSAEEWERVTRRLENLEAIVTSESWENRGGGERT